MTAAGRGSQRRRLVCLLLAAIAFVGVPPVPAPRQQTDDRHASQFHS